MRAAGDTLSHVGRGFSRAVQRQVERIVTDVRLRGDAAVREWSRKLDGLTGPFEVSPAELRQGWKDTPREVRAAIRLAVRHVGMVAAQALSCEVALIRVDLVFLGVDPNYSVVVQGVIMVIVVMIGGLITLRRQRT